MSFFNFDFKKLVFLLFIIALPLISINTQKGPDETQWFSKPFSFIAEITSNAFFSFSNGVKGTTANYLNLINIKKENADLRNQNSELLTRLIQMEELLNENNRLSTLLEFKQKNKMDLVGAKLIGRDLISEHNTIRINKGKNHGLKQGQAVITPKGVVGYIFRPEQFSSQVLLITDRYAVIDGVLQKSRSKGIVEGQGQHKLVLTYVEKSEDVEVGDLVITNGLDNIFPKGLPIATVKEIEKQNFNLALKIALTPVVDPNKLEEVFVVTNANNIDLEVPLVPETESETKAPQAAAAATTPQTAPAATTAPAAKKPENKP